MKFILRTSASVLALLLYFTSNIRAQQPGLLQISDSLPEKKLSEVVVSANRYGTIQLKTPDPVRVLDIKTIENHQLRTSSESLIMTPGVFVQKTNHGGGSPFLRGLTGNQTLLLVDGIRLSNATMRYGPNQYFNTIDVFSLEKIEVLRGSGSVQYGSDAIGGTIQTFSIEPKTSAKPLWGSSLLTRIATQNMEKTLRGSINFGNKKVAIIAGATRRKFGDIIGGDTTGRQTPTGYDEIDFDLKGRILLSSKTSLTMAYQDVHQNDVPVFHKVVLENYNFNKMDPQERELAYIKLNHNTGAGIVKSTTITASYQHSRERRELLKNGSTSLRTETDLVKSLSFSAEAMTSDKKNWSANSGIDIYKDIVNSDRFDKNLLTNDVIIKRGLYPDGATMTSIAAFSMHTFDFNHWIINAGARYNTFINKVKDENEGTVTLTPSAVVGNFAILRKLTSSSNLFFSANTGFRAPNIDDMGTLGIVDFRYEIPNYDLKPEHSIQYQVGYKQQGSLLRGELYFYRNELYDLIVRNKIPGDTIEGYPVYIKENIERAFIRGIETNWEFDISRSVLIKGSLTWTYGENLTKHEPVRRIPPLYGYLALEYNYKNAWANIEWLTAAKQDRLAAGDKEDNRIPAGGTPGWNILNVNTSYTFRFIKVNLSILNIFNQDYRYHGSGVNGYGRSAFLSVLINI